MIRTTSAVLCLLLAACAGPAATAPKATAPTAPTATAPSDAAAAPAADEKVVAVPDQTIECTMEKPTGSNIPERVCRLVDRRPDSKLQTKEQLLNNRSVQRGSQ